MSAPATAPPDATGLTVAEAARRLAARGPAPRPAAGRSYASIVRANVLTVFNLILAVFGSLTLAFGDWRDALFLLVLVANAAIGIVQEVRAKRSLERLALLVAPTAAVLRDGELVRVGPQDLVTGDVIRVEAGDQVLADGVVARSDGLLLDEAILTGESEPVARHPGDEVRSGAFAVEGAGLLSVTAVGPDSYAEQLLGTARGFRHPRSPLERANNRLLLALVAAVVTLGSVLVYGLVHSHIPLREATATATAGVVSLVPEGLVLLTSLTFAVGAVRMARQGVLAQQLNAIESLAAADTICLDKTGTLTEATLRVAETMPAAGVSDEELRRQAGRFAASAPVRNLTLEAIAAGCPATAEPADALVAFSSRRRFSALRIGGDVLVLGAPELFVLGDLAAAVAARTAAGRRVVALGHAGADAEPAPGAARLLGLLVISEALRHQTRATVAFLRREGVELKVLSGDAPATVGAIAADAGIAAGDVVDGSELPESPEALRALALRASVVGRISPEGKRRVVEALGDAGQYVAMVGDGVNDVPALKAARLAIAQGNGAQIARSVADLVLVRGDFATVPPMIGEGRRMLRNLQRVARLYVAKAAFAAFLILTIGTSSEAYPLLPRHFTLAATLTVGIPTFFLALAPSSGEWRTTGYARDVARFAVPAGTLVGVGVVAGYLFALHDLDLSLDAARTAATTTLVVAGLYLVLVLEGSGRRRRVAVGALCAAMAGLYVLALALPAGRTFFALHAPTPAIVATAAGGALVAVVLLVLAGFVPGADRAP